MRNIPVLQRQPFKAKPKQDNIRLSMSHGHQIAQDISTNRTFVRLLDGKYHECAPVNSRWVLLL